MGQYYKVVNIDKKAHFSPHDTGNGLKLMEWSYVGTYTTNALCQLLYGSWRGDRVYVVGDYAGSDDQQAFSENYVEVLKNLEAEFPFMKEEGGLYSYAGTMWAGISPDTKDVPFAFLSNSKEMTYIDLRDLPECDEDPEWRVHPLPLLLCMGNGQGGGDYWGFNAKDVGRWVASSTDVRIWTEEDVAKGEFDLSKYSAYDPLFAE